MPGIVFKSLKDAPLAWQEEIKREMDRKYGQTQKKPKKRNHTFGTQPVQGGSKINEDGSILLVIPHPPRSCSPNVSVHWSTLYQAKKRLAGWTLDAITEAFGVNPKPKWTRASIAIVWFHKKGKQLDSDNAIASCKAAIDQLQKSEIVVNDREATILPVTFFHDQERPRVEILIREIK